MKRGMKITLGGIVLLLAVLLLLPKLYERQAEAFIRSAAAALRGELRVGRLDIGLLRSFPRATVTLRDVVFVGDGIFAGDTLLFLVVDYHLPAFLFHYQPGIECLLYPCDMRVNGICQFLIDGLNSEFLSLGDEPQRPHTMVAHVPEERCERLLTLAYFP